MDAVPHTKPRGRVGGLSKNTRDRSSRSWCVVRHLSWSENSPGFQGWEKSSNRSSLVGTKDRIYRPIGLHSRGFLKPSVDTLGYRHLMSLVLLAPVVFFHRLRHPIFQLLNSSALGRLIGKQLPRQPFDGGAVHGRPAELVQVPIFHR